MIEEAWVVPHSPNNRSLAHLRAIGRGVLGRVWNFRIAQGWVGTQGYVGGVGESVSLVQGHIGMNGVLVIVPCGQKKIWDRTPGTGPTIAKFAYTGPPFGINRAFAEEFGHAWVILSAKYGFIEPAFEIPEPYNITFKKRRSVPITAEQLREQVRQNNLARFTTIIGLGGKEYREAIELAFAGAAPRLCFPFSGLPIGKAMQATKRAIATNDPLWERKSIE